MAVWGSSTRIALASLALGVAGVLVGAQPSLSQQAGAVGIATPAPPLAQDEVLVRTKNGCGIIFGGVAAAITPEAAATAEKARSAYRDMTWTGECKHGLLHGFGAIAKDEDMQKSRFTREMQYDYYLGRRMFMRSQPAKFGFQPGTTMYVSVGGRQIEMTNTGDGSPFWGYGALNDSAMAEKSTRHGSADGNFVATWKAFCEMAVYEKLLPRCERDGKYPIYGVEHGVAGTPGAVTLCPDPRTSSGCNVLWGQYVLPIANANTAFLAEAQTAQTARQNQLDALNAPYIAQLAIAENQRQAAARAAEAAAVLAKEKQERAFTASLTTLGAGQLFTKADELDRAGDAEKARAARTALINRFPNSPLAATAAQQLAGSRSAGASAPSMSPSANAATASSPARASDDPTAGYAAMRSACAGPIASTKAAFRGAFGIELTDRDVGRSIFMMWGHRLSTATGERQIEATLATQRSARGRDTPYALADAEMSRCFHREAMRFASAGGASSVPGGAQAPSRQTQASQSPAGSATPPTSSVAQADTNGSVGCAATPQQSFQNFDREFAAFTRANPNPGQARGAQAQYQYTYFFSVRGLGILEKYRSCMSPADFTANTNQLVAARDAGKRGCEQLSSSTNFSCPVEMPR